MAARGSLHIAALVLQLTRQEGPGRQMWPEETGGRQWVHSWLPPGDPISQSTSQPLHSLRAGARQPSESFSPAC